MTADNNCPFRKEIDCLPGGGQFSCAGCGWNPTEERNRKMLINQQIAELETGRATYIMQLKIKHSKYGVSYKIRRVRKRTASPKTNSQLKNQHGVG